MNTEGKTVGEMLRGAREAKQLTIEQVNRETRISVQTLRALEEDDFGAFSSEMYLKGFLRNYAEFLGLDGAQLWSMVGRRSSPAGSAPAWDVEESLREEKLGTPGLVRRLLIPLLVVAVIALVVMLMRERRRAGGAQAATAVESIETTG